LSKLKKYNGLALAKSRRSLAYQRSDFCVQTLSETCLDQRMVYSMIASIIFSLV